MKRLLAPYLIALLFAGGNALAAERLSDLQMDLISAGALPTCAGASGCNVSTSLTTTNTAPDANGVLHTTTTNTYSCTAGSCGGQAVNDGNPPPPPPQQCSTSSCSDTVTNPKDTNASSGSTVSGGVLTLGSPVSVPIPGSTIPPITIPPIFLGG